MIKVWYWLKWFFSVPGIQYTTSKPVQVRMFGWNLFWFNKHLGIGYLPGGPSSAELTVWATMKKVMHRTFEPYKCKYCGTVVWSYRRVDVCESFTCFVKNGGKWC